MGLRLEQRIAPRRNTNIQAEIMFSGGQTLGCTIRNVSETGAKLQLRSIGRVPASLELFTPGHHPQRCQVMWRTLREIGVQFV